MSQRSLGALSVLFLLSPLAAAQTGSALARAVTDVVLDPSGADPSRWTILCSGGRIERLLPASEPVPPGYWRLDGQGLLALPAFVDACTRTGCATPQPTQDQDRPPDLRADVGIDMREANRKGIEPAFRAASVLAFDEAARDAWQEAGFGTAYVCPGGELLAGHGVLAAVRDAAARDLVITPALFQHAAFAASGAGYPSTAMGYMAQLRQFFLDARHQREALERFAAGRPGPRPPYDAELEAGVAIVSGDERLACDADQAQAIDRWLRLARELGLSIVLTGGGEAWRLADDLAAEAIPVLLTLRWSEEVPDPFAKEKEKKEEPDEEAAGVAETVAADEPAAPDAPQPAPDAPQPAPASGEAASGDEYREPLAVRAERRRQWEEERDGALRLHEAGVPIAFGSGEGRPATLLERVRTLVEAGFPVESARDALTSGAAAILGAGERLGRIAPGYDATFVLWKGDPLADEKARVRWILVDGCPREFPAKKELEGKPDEGVDLSGSWTLAYERRGRAVEAQLTLTMAEDGTVEGTLSMPRLRGDGRLEASVRGKVARREVRLEAELELGEQRVPLEIEGTLEKDAFDGTITTRPPGRDAEPHAFHATREKPGQEVRR